MQLHRVRLEELGAGAEKDRVGEALQAFARVQVIPRIV
jgi:hypothetical protein